MPKTSLLLLPYCSIRSFTQTPEGLSAVVDAAPDGNGGGGNIYRLAGALAWLCC
jgi:hypothetical protein